MCGGSFGSLRRQAQTHAMQLSEALDAVVAVLPDHVREAALQAYKDKVKGEQAQLREALQSHARASTGPPRSASPSAAQSRRTQRRRTSVAALNSPFASPFVSPKPQARRPGVGRIDVFVRTYFEATPPFLPPPQNIEQDR